MRSPIKCAFIKHKHAEWPNDNIIGFGCMLMSDHVGAETEAKLWPYVWAGGNDTGV